MLSYKYYKENPNKSKTYAALKTVNQIIRDSYAEALNMAMTELKNPTNMDIQRYNIWDNIGSYADEIIKENWLELSQVDKIYLAKLLGEFRCAQMINPGLEYYCLLQIIKLRVFRSKTQLSDIAARISYFISKYKDRDVGARKAANSFARNVRKIHILKRAYGSRIILRSTWVDIYQCYKFGKQVLTEELNQTDILNGLGLTPNSTTPKFVVIDVIPEDELTICDINSETETETETESLPNVAEYDIVNDDVLQNNQLGDVNHDVTSTSGQYASDIDTVPDEPELHVLDPDEW